MFWVDKPYCIFRMDVDCFYLCSFVVRCLAMPIEWWT